MFTTIEQFKREWELESANTEKIFANLTDASLNQKITNDHRTLGRLAWHIVQTIPEMGDKIGLNLEGPTEKEPVPTSATKIQKAYQIAAQSLLNGVVEHWDDNTLDVEDDLYGETWKRGATLFILLKHEMHHRGQLTVLMRQAGLKVPGIYGPSKEEWTQFGMPEPEI